MASSSGALTPLRPSLPREVCSAVAAASYYCLLFPLFLPFSSPLSSSSSSTPSSLSSSPFSFSFGKTAYFHFLCLIQLKELQDMVDYTFPTEQRVICNIIPKGNRGIMHQLVTLYRDVMSYNERPGSCRSPLILSR